ncbi:hypothetical protein SCHPADRAFT_263677 [Schizopora paradoxa]|uniref:Nephrocystin 3-like N-terminal domain-containing protein n=1 Tax=Schizopora paradoxa TaxID=27342 RepID=A0A0H2SEM3_9AGAM|nr:hypothetical protein SCHPADRAFT_263677 [Schizopora paradoxa]
MKERGDDMSFLRNKLEPSDQLRMDNGWMDGSRETVMSTVDTWLESCDEPNVLWLSGAPGAGKSAIASIIVKKLHDSSSEFDKTYNCAKFFIKRGHTTLDDPRTIWRSIAMGLVDSSLTDRWYRSLKVDVLEVMTQRVSNLYPKDVSIEDQFRDLICRPLNNLFKLTAGPSSSRRVVVVIDALDECNLSDTENQEQWSAFLGTVVRWSTELPKTCKLFLTSRLESAIEEKLKEISRPLVLNTGNDVSDESIRDIELLFKKRFEEKKVEQKQIEELAKYAAGLFIWATTVIEYVNHGDFGDRLEEVLANMSAAGARGGDSDKIGMLYGQILFTVAWERRNHPKELDRLSLVLASVIPGILRRPLPLRVLGILLSPNPEAILWITSPTN